MISNWFGNPELRNIEFQLLYNVSESCQRKNGFWDAKVAMKGGRAYYTVSRMAVEWCN